MINDNHPELREDEIFICNTAGTATHCTCLSKRIGKIAYNIYDDEMTILRPIFINKNEYSDFIKSKRSKPHTP